MLDHLLPWLDIAFATLFSGVRQFQSDILPFPLTLYGLSEKATVLFYPQCFLGPNLNAMAKRIRGRSEDGNDFGQQSNIFEA